ncbi:MAG: Preprotein translocase subunit YajC [Chloroflexi bacterium]|nr:MAG: Preprotein translocase subunit YajC [Chloroflexota bacterium]
MAEVLLITALVLALFFIFFVRPARQVQGRRRRDLNELRIGDEVLTTGGIIAIVVAVETPPTGPMLLQLEIDDGVIVHARTSAIEERLRSATELDSLELSAPAAESAALDEPPVAGNRSPENAESEDMSRG